MSRALDGWQGPFSGTLAEQLALHGTSPGTYHARRRAGYSHMAAVTGIGVYGRGRPRKGERRPQSAEKAA
jgi:hypothetical protein